MIRTNIRGVTVSSACATRVPYFVVLDILAKKKSVYFGPYIATLYPFSFKLGNKNIIVTEAMLQNMRVCFYTWQFVTKLLVLDKVYLSTTSAI